MKKIEKLSLTDHTIDSIRNYLINSDFQRGDKLPTENEFSNRLGVSRSTIREALRALDSEGIIELVHGKGAFFNSISESNISPEKWFAENTYILSDVMNVRLAIEHMAIKLAIQNSTNEEIEELGKIQMEFEDVLPKGDYKKIAEIDECFHRRLCELSKNNLIISIAETLSIYLRTYRKKAFSIEKNRVHAVAPHREILLALRNRDVNRGVEAVSEHIYVSLLDMEDSARKAF